MLNVKIKCLEYFGRCHKHMLNQTRWKVTMRLSDVASFFQHFIQCVVPQNHNKATYEGNIAIRHFCFEWIESFLNKVQGRYTRGLIFSNHFLPLYASDSTDSDQSRLITIVLNIWVQAQDARLSWTGRRFTSGNPKNASSSKRVRILGCTQLFEQEHFLFYSVFRFDFSWLIQL